MIKRGYLVQMNYDVSDSEKQYASLALRDFKYAIRNLDAANNFLNMIKTPFKKTPDTPPEEIFKIRAALRRYRDKAVENFNVFKNTAFNCVKLMKNFSSDTQTVKLMKSFISAIDQLESSVNKMVDLFDDLKSPEFTKKIVEIIEKIQKDCATIVEISDERIKEHIEDNILAQTWVDTVGHELNMRVEEKKPLFVELYNKTQDQLNETIKERGQLGN
jgi:uncharacterized protein (UPF0335 family)